MAQRLDGVQLRGFARGHKAEEHADHGREDEGDGGDAHVWLEWHFERLGAGDGDE